MKKEYDFSEGVRGKFYRPNKVQKTIRFDQDIFSYFKMASKRTLTKLTDNMALSEIPKIKTLRKTLIA